MIIENTTVIAQYPWPVDTKIQGGDCGLVGFGDQTRFTAFVEVFFDPEVNPCLGFVRGEGDTIQEAETQVWEKTRRIIQCGHEFEPRGYKNGGGVCKHCEGFASHVYTPEDLGLSCRDCGTPTFWHRENAGKDDEFFICEKCYPVPFDAYPDLVLEHLVKTIGWSFDDKRAELLKMITKEKNSE